MRGCCASRFGQALTTVNARRPDGRNVFPAVLDIDRCQVGIRQIVVPRYEVGSLRMLLGFGLRGGDQIRWTNVPITGPDQDIQPGQRLGGMRDRLQADQISRQILVVVAFDIVRIR